MNKRSIKMSLFGLLTLMALCAIFLGTRYARTGAADTNQTRLFRLDVAQGHDKVDSRAIALVDDRHVLVALAPRPDILRYAITSEGSMRLETRLDRSGWAINAFDAVDHDIVFALGEYGTLLRSGDGGMSWINLPKFTEYELLCSSFETSEIGYIAGRFGTRDQETGRDRWSVKIWKTTDGGMNWTESYFGYNQRDISRLTILNNGIVFGVVDGLHLIRTVDGGKTWLNSYESTSGIVGLDRFGEDLILTETDGERIISADDGISWAKGPAALLTDVLSVDLNQFGRGLAISQNGEICFTSNEGKNWTRVTLVNSGMVITIGERVAVIATAKDFYLLSLD